MNPAGLLRVRARFAGHALADLAVSLQRPPVARLFVGQSPEAVVKTVPYLYTLCAHAQRAAAQAALAAAAEKSPRPADDAELWIEFLHENLWRLLLDWPPALGLAPAGEAFVAWRNARLGAARFEATQQLLAGALRESAEKCLARLGDNQAAAPGAAAALDPGAWLAYWQGCRGDRPASRRPPSIGAAYRARLAEVNTAAAALAGQLPYPVAAAGGAGWGVGQTLTARGVLTHAVHVEGDCIRNYHVSAPTDCHFADAGALSALLAGGEMADAATARRVLEQAVLALDPCLPYELELNHA